MMLENISPETIQRIKHSTEQSYQKLVDIRRDLHQHPEQSGHETWTSSYLLNHLRNLNLDIRSDVGGNGIVADLIKDPHLPMAALRVDMDALPIEEINQHDYRSKIPGVMHACGHDVHCAIGIGVAQVLKKIESELPGNIRLIFQPEEEEITGALKMIEAGALDSPTPSAIFSLHVSPLPVGQVAVNTDLFLAGFDHYLCILLPQPGASLDENHLDSLAKQCCQMILSLNDIELPTTWEAMQSLWDQLKEGSPDLRHFMIFDASVNEEEPSAWIGQFGVGIKAANHHLRRMAKEKVRSILKAICTTNQAVFKLLPMGDMPDMRNDPALVKKILSVLCETIEPENVFQLKAAFPFNCEDFAFYTQIIPGAMVWIGAANPEQGKYALLHTPDFDVDERCIQIGTNVMASVLYHYLYQIVERGN